MKRYNNLFDKIVSLDNLYLADKKARRNKSSVPSAQRCFSNLYLITRQLKATATPIIRKITTSI